MTPEGKVKAAIKRVLVDYEPYQFMPVQNGMGTPGLDFYLCVRGRFIAIEAKALGGTPTPRQCVTMADIERAGGTVFLVSDADLLRMALRAWARGWVKGIVECR